MRKMRHQPSWRLSQPAPTGMKTCRILVWFSSQVRVKAEESRVQPGANPVEDHAEEPFEPPVAVIVEIGRAHV